MQNGRHYSYTYSTLRLPLYILSAIDAYQKAYGTHTKKRDDHDDGGGGAKYLC